MEEGGEGIRQKGRRRRVMREDGETEGGEQRWEDGETEGGERRWEDGETERDKEGKMMREREEEWRREEKRQYGAAGRQNSEENRSR